MKTSEDLWEEIELPKRLTKDFLALKANQVLIEEEHKLYDYDDED